MGKIGEPYVTITEEIIVKEKEILKLHSQNMNTKDIAIQVGLSRQKVSKILKKYNLKSNNNKPFNPKLFTEEEISFMIDRYNEGMTCEEIYNNYFFGRCKGHATIQALLSKRIELRRRGKRIDFDENFFENIDTERKAYWLGFIYADGNVLGNRLRIELKSEDSYILEELNKDLGSKNKVCHTTGIHYFNGYKIEKDNSYIGWCSDKLVEDLAKYGVVPNKTFKLNSLPNIKRYLLRHFIRGYFDGDGTVYINKKRNRLIFGFYGQYKLLEAIENILVEDIGISPIKIFDKGTVCQVTFSRSKDVLNFYDYIYKDSTVFLLRKRKKFDLFLN